jgi:biopolymer transport protein ExbB
MDQSLWEILQEHYSMWVILALSVLAVTVALERMVVLWRFLERARTLADVVTRCLTRGALDEGRSACERSRSPLAEVFLVGYERLGRSQRKTLHGAVNRERLRVATSLKSHLWIIGTTGAVSPFVGLFGTVVGIMAAFGEIQKTQETGLRVVSGGISVALYATAAGILVAVLAVVIYNYFNQRLARIAVELKLYTDEFLELLDDFGPDADRAAARPPSGDGDADDDQPAEGDQPRGSRSGTREAA